MAKIKVHHLTANEMAEELKQRFITIHDQLIGISDNIEQNSTVTYTVIDKLKLDGDIEAINSVLREIKKLKSK